MSSDEYRRGYARAASRWKDDEKELRDRIAELEDALRDCTAFVVVHVDRYTRDNGGEMHETHRELLDRIGRLTGRNDLVQRLDQKK